MALGCPGPGPDPNWCPQTTDEAFDSVIGLLPPGRAWASALDEGTPENGYWRAFASVLAFTYKRLCEYVDEFFCHSAKESLDQWIAEYGLDDPCDPYGHNLCVKVAAQGGATCDYFVEIAALSGYDITCTDLSKDPEPIAGCFEVGCTPLGPTPLYLPYGANEGFGQRGCDWGGEVTNHPDPEKWENGRTAGAYCAVPGSNLGYGPDADESCCFVVGYYEMPTGEPEAAVTTYCQDNGDVITFECPRRDVPFDPSPSAAARTAGPRDSTGNYIEWGNAFVWQIEINGVTLPAPVEASNNYTSSSAGCLMAGAIAELPDGSYGGTPLCAEKAGPEQASLTLCFLERIAPAHTTLIQKVN